MHTVTLNNGVQMPVLGFGVFQIEVADQQLFGVPRGVQIESWGPFAEGRNGLFADVVKWLSGRSPDVRAGRRRCRR